MSTVIVFGPTGNIASIAAQAAEKRGAKVVLAMRDPSKKISGLDADAEKNGRYQRVQADLSKPETVAAAVQSTGAKRAFFYLAHGSQDGMKATITALKSAGIDFAVFLSSSSVQVPVEDVPPSDLIPFVHAAVEKSLREVFGAGHYVAVRPGRFATNLFRYKQGLRDGEVRLLGKDYLFDNITPEDMGIVSGELLVNGPRDGEQEIYLYAPRWNTLEDSVLTVARVLRKEIKIISVSKEQGIEDMIKNNVPRPMAQYMAEKLVTGEDREAGNNALHQTGRDNIRKYAGREPLGLKEWVEANKELFTSA